MAYPPEQTFHFLADIRCHLVNGEEQVVRGYRVRVDALTREEARSCVREVATEMVHDAGSDLTDAPLDDLELISVRDDA